MKFEKRTKLKNLLVLALQIVYTMHIRQFREECGFARIGGVRSHQNYPGNTFRLEYMNFMIF